MKNIIEVLGANNVVITKVSNSGNPDKDAKRYGGTSWRVWVEPDSARVENLRRRKIADTTVEGLRRIASVIPAINSLAALDLMVELWPMLDTASAGANILLVKDIYQYAKTKIVAAQTATESQLNAYDPASDAGWPN